MNKWVGKSINLANSNSYLDNLFYVYPISEENLRALPENIRREIIKNYNKKDKQQLIRTLLKLKKFPIDDPYIAYLRKNPEFLEKNPKTLKRIGEKLLSMGSRQLIIACGKPKSSSRQFGQAFRNWLPKIGIPFIKKEIFKSYKKAAFLEGSDDEIKRFSINELGLKNLKRRPDFLLKVGSNFILGEAKFLTDTGGTQNNQFDGALTISKIRNNYIAGAAVIDGVVWIRNNTYMHKKVKNIKGIALSALLLREFIKSLAGKNSKN